MRADHKERLIQCIKNNDIIARPMLVIGKMLEQEKVGLFTNSCYNRIRDAGFIDDVHIIEDFCGLSADLAGLKKARMILEGYIEPEMLSKYEEAIQYQEELTDYLNNTLYVLRHQDRKGLKKMYREALSVEKGKEPTVCPELISLEISQRRWWSKVQRSLRYLKTVCRAIIDTQMPIRGIPLYLTLVFPPRKVGKYDPGYGGGKYYKALKRFEAAHEGQKHLSHDDLKRYVFLGINAFGKEYLRNERKSKSFYEIKWKYDQCHRIMEALGRITPRELMQMFPVEKKYDGSRWNEKDYFYTMERLKGLDKPIGTEQEAACIFWDYTNTALDFFFLNWMDSVDDLKIYVGDEEPRKKWRVAMDKRYKIEGAQ